MWYRAELKQNAKDVLKKNYWMPFAVSLVYPLLSGSAGSVGGSSGGTGFGLSIINMRGVQAENSLLYAIAIMLIVLLGVALAFALQFFVSGPIEVGKRRFYMENRDSDPSFTKLFYGFKHQYLNNSTAMFTTNLFIGLWSLLFVIPGIIKGLAWSQVPYILAENPGMTGKRAREISECMTAEQKGDIFVLELSFIGWSLLGALACGIGSFFVAPYVDATYAELYARLRSNVLENGLVSPEELPGFEHE